MIKIKKGLDLPIAGAPEQRVESGQECQTVALVGPDYVGMKPTMAVKVGDNVKLGQVLFADKKNPSVQYTAPGAGRIREINRGEKRAFLAIAIDLAGSSEVTFPVHKEGQLQGLDREKVQKQLLDSGLWTALRTRPYSKVADPAVVPNSIFVTAMDSHPLAPSVETILTGREKDFENGLTLLSHLTDGNVFVCKAPESKMSVPDNGKIITENFSGPHPAGVPGTHIHFLDPVSRKKSVWYVSAQDVAAIGKLFTTGKLDVSRIVALAGPGVKNPRLLRTRIGANLQDLTRHELKESGRAGAALRIVSGSVLGGRTATNEFGYLGRYHQQVTVLEEGTHRAFLGWLTPGLNEFSVKNTVLSKLVPGKRFNFSTAQNGGVRAIVPSGEFERVVPLRMMPLFLVRALAVDDVEEAEQLGALELDEEDLALCSFVCPSKLDYGPMLRRNLTLIEKEG